MTFPTSVNVQPGVAVAGDFASTNPRVAVSAGPGGLVAGSSGVTVGLFGWIDTTSTDPNGQGTLVNNTGSGVPTGIVARRQQALVTTYLAEASNVIPAGFPVTLFSSGDFWVKNAGSGAAAIGNKVFVKTADGTVNFAAAGATVSGSVETKFFALSAGAANELVKISSHALG